LEGVPPDRAADREADVALHRRAGAQPLVDLRAVGAAPEHDAGDAVTAARARLRGDPPAVLGRVDALDLPDVRLDPGVLDLLDRLDHEIRAQLAVVAVGVAVDLRELLLRRRYEQLEEELPVTLVQPVREALELGVLALVELGVALGVVADEHLREVRVELLDVLAEGLAVLEVELVLAALLDRHRELQAAGLRILGDRAAELLVDEAAGRARLGAVLGGDHEPLVDQVLRVGDRPRLLRRRIALDAE